MIETRECRHCGRDIGYSQSLLRWMHIETRASRCDLNSDFDEPVAAPVSSLADKGEL